MPKISEEFFKNTSTALEMTLEEYLASNPEEVTKLKAKATISYVNEFNERILKVVKLSSRLKFNQNAQKIYDDTMSQLLSNLEFDSEQGNNLLSLYIAFGQQIKAEGANSLKEIDALLRTEIGRCMRKMFISSGALIAALFAFNSIAETYYNSTQETLTLIAIQAIITICTFILVDNAAKCLQLNELLSLHPNEFKQLNEFVQKETYQIPDNNYSVNTKRLEENYKSLDVFFKPKSISLAEMVERKREELSAPTSSLSGPK